MIKLRQPSLALHSCDVPGYEYQMWQTWKMPKGARPIDVVYWILYARDHSPELRLHNVVINCHGLDGRVYVGGDGQTPINSGNQGVFTQVRGKDLGTIWLVACQVASTSVGRGFCRRLAQLAGCSVVAADVNQYGAIWCPSGHVDNFEGHTFEWNAAGSCKLVTGDGAGIPGVED